MARTKQTARKGTGGKAPKKQIVKKAAAVSEVAPEQSFTFTMEQLSAAFEKANQEAIELTIQSLKSA